MNLSTYFKTNYQITDVDYFGKFITYTIKKNWISKIEIEDIEKKFNIEFKSIELDSISFELKICFELK